jgi:hypothetical protein
MAARRSMRSRRSCLHVLGLESMAESGWWLLANAWYARSSLIVN